MAALHVSSVIAAFAAFVWHRGTTHIAATAAGGRFTCFLGHSGVRRFCLASWYNTHTHTAAIAAGGRFRYEATKDTGIRIAVADSSFGSS